MFNKTLKQYTKWLAVNLACLTMVFSPVAMGREAEALNAKTIQLYLQEFGLTGKKITLGEFWEKSKAYFPAYVSKDLEKFVQENKNRLMPEINVSTAKATDGSIVPVLRVTSGGKSATIQIFNEKNKVAKYNNVVLSEEDFYNVGAVFKRIEASDSRLKKEADQYRTSQNTKANQKKNEAHQHLTKVVQDFARFKGFPRLSPGQWKQMTQAQRAGYIVNMRLLWQDARQVLRLQEAAAAKVAPKGRKYSSFDEFSKILLGEEAQAAANSAVANTSAKPKLSRKGESVVQPGAASAPAAPQSKKCIVAGYVSEEGKGVNYGGERTACSEALVFQSEKYSRDTPAARMVQEARAECLTQSKNYVACNPLIYAYKADGNAICVDRTKTTPSAPAPGNIQKATWWEGPCDQASKLTENQIQDGMKATDKSYAEDDKRFDEKGNIKAEVAQKQINLIEEDQFKTDSYKKTQAFLDSVLKNKNRKDSKIDFTMQDLIDGKKPWSKEIDDMLVDVQSQFEVEIGEAIQSCEKSISRKDNVDQNQKGACDQLHRRWLFTERFISQFRAKSCLGGSTYIWELDKSKMSKDQIDNAKLNKEKLKSDSELMCQCPNNPDQKIKFNDDKSCGLPPASASAKCPTGMEEKVQGFCSCAGSGEYIPMNEALDRASLETVEKMCPNAPEKEKCDKPEGIADYDYTTCECSKGSLKDENEQGFISKLFSGSKEKKEPKWVCKETDWLPWVLGGLGIAALIALIHKHKKENKQQPPVTPPQSCAPKSGVYPNCACALTAASCAAGQKLNAVTCSCDYGDARCPDDSLAAGNDVTKCPKCSDGSYKQLPTTAFPNGCPQSSEGGSGTAICPTPPCSGGIPTGGSTGQ